MSCPTAPGACRIGRSERVDAADVSEREHRALDSGDDAPEVLLQRCGQAAVDVAATAGATAAPTSTSECCRGRSA